MPSLGATGNSVTLRDVARAAGTSAMTVSNVVNGRAGQVGADLRARVEATCSRLGYRPHSGARQLRVNRHMSVGVIIADASPHYLSDPFTAAVLAGLNDAFSAEGYTVALHSAPPHDVGRLPPLRRISTDGVMLMTSGRPTVRRKLIARIAGLGQPLVLIQDELPRGLTDACSLLQDDRGGACEIARHLLAEPAAHAVMLVPEISWPAMERRQAGILAELALAAAPPRFHVVTCGDESFEATQAALATHCRHNGYPDIIIGGNDRMAIAAMKWLVSRGRRVPDDVRVTGFNGFDFWRYANPELTTVRSPAFELGETGARAMLTRLQTGRFPFRDRILPVVFSPQQSSDRRANEGTPPRSRRRHIP
jgi:LacI family transcriptional regulator